MEPGPETISICIFYSDNKQFEVPSETWNTECNFSEYLRILILTPFKVYVDDLAQFWCVY